jgi:U1 small nuclear ribonucleoprotein 70kDa
MTTDLISSASRKERSELGKINSKNTKKLSKKHMLNVGLDLNLGQPYTQDGISEDPKKTIIVGRLNFDTTEDKLKDEFSIYGDIKMVRLIRDNKGVSRGYAFIEFESRRDFLCILTLT